MLRSAEQLRGFSIQATDGEIGRVDGFLFDPAAWTIRYLVVRTGTFLMGRLVLVAPGAIDQVDHVARILSVALTAADVEHSPDVDAERPDEMPPQGIGLARYHGQSAYWGGPGVWSASAHPDALDGGAASRAPGAERPAPDDDAAPARLRSTHGVAGYRIRARDGEIGHVDDFIVDDGAWAIRYVVVDTGTWWPGRRVLVSPEWIRNVSWSTALVAIDLEREAIREGPEYDPSRVINREDEEQLYRHHRRRGYWEDRS